MALPRESVKTSQLAKSLWLSPSFALLYRSLLMGVENPLRRGRHRHRRVKILLSLECSIPGKRKRDAGVKMRPLKARFSPSP